jgi:CheY-like chemotaxis protein
VGAREGIFEVKSVSSIQTDVINIIRERKLSALIVDDEPSFRKAMSFELRRKYGVSVDVVESGTEAIQKLRAGNSYDYIFLDVMMSPLSGVDTYPQLRVLDNKSRIVMMSAYSDSDDWNRAKEMNIELVPKPIPDSEMERILSGR